MSSVQLPVMVLTLLGLLLVLLGLFAAGSVVLIALGLAAVLAGGVLAVLAGRGAR